MHLCYANPAVGYLKCIRESQEVAYPSWQANNCTAAIGVLQLRAGLSWSTFGLIHCIARVCEVPLFQILVRSSTCHVPVYVKAKATPVSQAATNCLVLI